MNNASLTEEIKLVSWFNHTDRLLLLAQKSANVNTSAQFCGHHLLLGVELGLGFSHWSTIKLVTSVFCYDQEIIERMATRASICYRPQRSWGKVIFSQASVILSRGEACVVARGSMCGCQGGMHGCREACVVAGGCVWLPGGVCMVAGGACVVAGGHASLQGVGGMHGCQGMCMVVRGVCMGYDEIHSMSGRYASYWNAFLFMSVYFYQLIMIRVKAEGRF